MKNRDIIFVGITVLVLSCLTLAGPGGGPGQPITQSKDLYPYYETFLRIVYRHEASGPPPQPTLRWTRDGKAVTFSTRGSKAFFALDKEGKPTGWLPAAAKHWPERIPQKSDSREFRRKLSNAQVDVARLVNEHGGLVRRQPRKE